MPRTQRPYGEEPPRKSAMPTVWLALIIVALAVLAAVWNFLQ